MLKAPSRVWTASLLVAALVAPFAPSSVAEAKPKKVAAKAQASSSRGAKGAPKKPSAPAAAPGRNSGINMQRSQFVLPKSEALKTPEAKQRSLGAVKPPRSNEFLDGGSKEAEYERLVDQEIAALYKLSQQNKRSQNRGEIWLRLGERYVEKARLSEFRSQAEYDKKLKDFQDKKTGIKPKLEQGASREYNKKAVELYTWFINDFPNDSKVDQALFFLGYNQFELGNTQLGEKYYQDLVTRFPNSAYVTESYFALGEFYFENEAWQKALDSYTRVVQVRKARLNAFALYKSAWCLYRVGRTPTGLKALERVVRMSRAAEAADSIQGRKSVNKVRLASEAMKDYVPFFAESGNPQDAVKEFQRVAGEEQQAIKMIERLAYIYADSGNRPAANLLFKQLIGMNPTGERAAEYQYQVVLTFATSDQKEFRRELEVWLESFGPTSFWAKENAKNEKLVSDTAKLQESTVRNNVLQLHQTAQNSRAQYSQQVAHAAYVQYFKYFGSTDRAAEMRFFHGELLFDMGRYEDAAKVYSWVAENDKKGEFREKAIINAVLALEKDLPSSQQIDEKRGNSLEKIPLDPPVQRFEKAAVRYIQALPKGEKTPDIMRRLGVLYYGYNHFDEAIDIFEKLVKDNPKSPNAEIAGNLLLDIYKLRGDMAGFAEKGTALLAIPGVASTKFGAQVKGMMEKANYMRADKLSETGDTKKAAKEFEDFAANYKGSELGNAARFKAAVNYEKAGELAPAIRMYNMVLAGQSNDPKIKSAQNDARNALARIYQQTGQLELAAKQYGAYAAANPKDQKAVNAYYNAGLIWEALGDTGQAMKSYDAYIASSTKADRFEVLFAQAEIHRKAGNRTKAMNVYEQYLNKGPRNEGHAIEAMFRIGAIVDKQGNRANARRWYSRAVEAHKKAGRQGKEGGVRYAAEARFELAQETFRELKAIRFTANEKQQAQAGLELKRLREKYINEMKEVIRYDNAPMIVAALASSGEMFEGLANVLSRVPVPAGFAGDDAKKYKELVQGQVDGFKKEAKNSYKAAIDKSHELESYNEWAQVATANYAALEPDAAGGNAGEVAADARAADWMGM